MNLSGYVGHLIILSECLLLDVLHAVNYKVAQKS